MVTADESYGQVKYLRSGTNNTMCRTCWPPGATTTCSPPPVAPAGQTRSSPRSRRSSGAGSPSAMARTAGANTPGCGSRSGSPGHPGAGTGCSPADPSRTPPRSPTTSAPGQAAPLTELATIAVAVADRGMLPADRERGRPRSRPLSGADLPRLVRAHRLADARPRPASVRKPKLLKGNRYHRTGHDRIHATRDSDPPTRPPRRSRLALVTLA